jgi:alkanesulfonate monooxygenase SsuD/methylene tetrahydromethanopterin reductase-like flavin-dependent oxidoreductase (luciferase family)
MDSINTALLQVFFGVLIMATATSRRSSPTMTTSQKTPSEPIHRHPVFGLSITPNDAAKAFTLAMAADRLGLDIIGIQDHPYNGTFLDTWILISTLAASTKRIRYFTDVCDLPMRPPAMLAKATATLDILTKGRVELGLGAGAFWDAIHSYGGPRRNPGEAVAALEEALQVIRLIWNYGGPRRRVSFPGKYYQLENAQAGPSPHHSIGIWLGATRPRMMELIGRSGDGWVIPLSSYMSPDEIRAAQQLINAAAKKNGRSPDAIARISNLIGVIDEQGEMKRSSGEKALFVGPSSQWVDWMVSSYRNLGVDRFVFWPSEGEEESQLRLFAERVVPKVRASLAEKTINTQVT